MFSGCLFYFFKILIFKVVKSIKGQRMAQNDKKLCLQCLISQEPYFIWILFMLHMCKRIIYPVFYIFQNLIFGIASGVKGQKMAKNDKKLSVCSNRYLRKHTSYYWCTCDTNMVHMCKKMLNDDISAFFSVFFFFNFSRGVCTRAKDVP